MTISLIKPIELLLFALDQEGIANGSYVIDESGVAPKGLSDQYCLYKNSDEMWECFYEERGRKVSYGCFSAERDAVKYFYSMITGVSGPWVYREDFEKFQRSKIERD